MSKLHRELRNVIAGRDRQGPIDAGRGSGPKVKGNGNLKVVSWPENSFID